MQQVKLFGDTDGIRGKANYFPLDVETIVNLGKALAEYVKKTAPPNPNREYRVIIGKDTRRSGYMIEQALTSGFLSRGVDVITIGPIPTPGLSHLVASFALDLGIQITASHNPASDNGIKVFSKNGSKLNKKEEEIIEDLFNKNGFAGQDKIGRAERIVDAVGRYIEFIKSTAENISLSGMKIVVDCANGAAYKVAPTVFEELGAKVITIGVEPDGYNINKDCGSLHTEKVREIVLKEKANLGIALDGDADRVIIIEEKGDVIDGDYITVLLAKSLKEKNKLNKNTIVITQYSNLAGDEELKKEGINVEKVINGDRFIVELCKNKGYNFGGEQTGHFIFLDYADTGDGTMTALQVIKIMLEKKKTLSELAFTFKKFPQKTFNQEIKKKVPLEKIPEIIGLQKKWEEKLKSDGRVFLRYSGTENLLRILVEAKDSNLIDIIGNEFVNLANKILN